MTINVIGGGLAGSEAAWQLAERGLPVTLWEMRPEKTTAAHESNHLAELVCSNSLGSYLHSSAGGLLKSELKQFNSLIVQCAEATKVPAGGALAVDRHRFAAMVSETLAKHPLVSIRRQECTEIPAEGVVIIATGPLSSEAMAGRLQQLTGESHLHFFDAAAPIVDGESVDYDKGFWAARYGKGTPDYFNCPMTKEEHEYFYQALTQAQVAPLHEGVEDVKVFEGCMPIEEMAKRGLDTLRYGPLRPVGLRDAADQRPYAVLQLRKENYKGTLLNLVGFQTRLTWPEQRRVFRLIPALHQAEFQRYGVMHRNTFINSPRVLNAAFQFRRYPRIFAAGQLTGVEGYVESTASGLMAALQAARYVQGRPFLQFPETTLMGALASHVATPNKDYQPMAANFGLLPPLAERIRDKQKRKEAYSQRALEDLTKIHNLQEN